MTMSPGQNEDASLSLELEELIRNHFDSQAQPAVRATLLSLRATLLSYGTAWSGLVTERVQFDLLHLGAGDPDKVKRLADLAAGDPRDVMTQEYFWVAGRFYPHPWARRHDINRNYPEPPEHDESLATAELVLRPSARTEGMPRFLPSLFLKFHDSARLLTFADRLLTLAEPGASVDTSTFIFFRGALPPQRTQLRCLDGDAPAALSHADTALTWDAGATYWIDCRSKCLKLAEAGHGILEMMPEASSQKIQISIPKIEAKGNGL